MSRRYVPTRCMWILPARRAVNSIPSGLRRFSIVRPPRAPNELESSHVVPVRPAQPAQQQQNAGPTTSMGSVATQAYEKLRSAEEEFLDRILQDHSDDTYALYSQPALGLAANNPQQHSPIKTPQLDLSTRSSHDPKPFPSSGASTTGADTSPSVNTTAYQNYVDGVASFNRSTSNANKQALRPGSRSGSGSDRTPDERIASICDRKHSAEKAWALFEAVPTDSQRPKTDLLRGIQGPLLQKMLNSWSAGKLLESKLSPSAVFRELHRQGFNPDVHCWRSLVVRAVKDAIRHYGQESPNPNAHLPPKSTCLELIRVWNVALEQDIPVDSDPGAALSQVATSLNQIPPTIFDPQLFNRVFPASLAKQAEGGCYLFVATYLILRDRCQRLDAHLDEVRQYQPLLEYAHKFMASCGFVPSQKVKAFLSATDPGFPANKIRLLCKNLNSYQSISPPTSGATAASATQRKTKTQTTKKSDSSHTRTAMKELGASSAGISIADIEAHLSKAVTAADVQHLESLWTQTELQIRDHNLALPETAYVRFIRAFAGLRRPNRAVDIWNAMIQAGWVPQLELWDVMIRGFGAVRDRRGVEQIWSMLQQTNTKLDGRIWAARLWALSSSVPEVMSCFEEMMNAWLRAVKRTQRKSSAPDLVALGDVDSVPKPTVHALNPVVQAAAMSSNWHRNLEQLFSWASALGIQPDIYTFNVIIRAAVKRDNTEMITRALNQMQKFQIKVDISTFTMLVQALFKQKPQVAEDGSEIDVEATSRHKLEALARILDEISVAGLAPNAYTFSIIISSLLKTPSLGPNNVNAAQAVIQHMKDKAIPLSSQIYTSIVTAHFETTAGTPDIEAVMQTWKEARRDDKVILDEVFYDRLIEGFAKCDDPKRMQLALAEAGRTGRVVGWIALTEATMALHRAGNLDAAREIVGQVEREEQGLDRLRKGKGQKWFWDTVWELGFASSIPQSTKD